MLVVVAPGQGSQRPGCLRPWLEHPRAEALLRSYGEVLGLDLVRLGTRGVAEEVRDTALAQPLLVAAGLLGARLLAEEHEHPTSVADVLGGHSVGEVTAATLAGSLGEEDALRLATTRGAATAAAVASAPSGMTAVVGASVAQVRRTAEQHGLSVATVNAPDQAVVAGPLPALARLAADPPPGVGLVPLEVAGAFHTEVMAPASRAVHGTLAELAIADPAVPVVSGLDGALVRSGHDLTERLGAQVMAPVRWDLCQQTFRRLGVTGLLELPPAGTLSALARRALPGVERFPLRGPDDLPGARAFVVRHAGRPGEP